MRQRCRGAMLLTARAALLALLLTLSGPVPAEAAASLSATSAAELEFVSDEYFLSTQLTIFINGTPVPYFEDQNVGGNVFFDRVEVSRRSDSDSELIFAVEESPDASLYEVCYSWPTCSKVSVGVNANNGLLFLSSDGPFKNDYYVNDFPSQRVELSLQEADGARKVYREVMVHRSQRVADCSDYPYQDKTRYTCLFLKEQIPPVPLSTTASMREALPEDLAQPKENYSLIFAEEFNGTDAVHSSGRCRNRMDTLNQDYLIWNYGTNPCSRVDSLGVPCNDIEDGHYYMALSWTCLTNLGTEGNFNYKYGYIEIKYTILYDAWSDYMNLALSVGNPTLPLRDQYRRYGIEQDNYESILKTLGGVVNFFEYLPGSRIEVMHSWVNPYGTIRLRNTPPVRTNTFVEYCSAYHNPALRPRPSGFCRTGGSVTVTKGMEWTPSGYRFLIKVHGVHDDFVVFADSDLEVQRKPPSEEPGGRITFGTWRTLAGEEHSSFFEHLQEGDADDVLVQVGVSHIPMDITLASWGNPTPVNSRIKTKLATDYIRVYQPTNGYRDMEPTFQ